MSNIIYRFLSFYLLHLDPGKTVEKALNKMVGFSRQLRLPLATFSSWDFTPEDVYLSPKGIKYADPHKDVVGMPIIDLACFGGVVRDAYILPGSIEGYKILRKFALDFIGPYLEVSRKDSEKIFYMGRVLQCFLSARFRYKAEPTKARKLFLQAKGYLAKVVD